MAKITLAKMRTSVLCVCAREKERIGYRVYVPNLSQLELKPRAESYSGCAKFTTIFYLLLLSISSVPVYYTVFDRSPYFHFIDFLH